jgi:hypothetical protein
VRHRVEQVVGALDRDVAWLLRQWGSSRKAALRAHLSVVTALSLVHEVVIQMPPGRRRSNAAAEVARVLAASIDVPSGPDRTSTGG